MEYVYPDDLGCQDCTNIFETLKTWCTQQKSPVAQVNGYKVVYCFGLELEPQSSTLWISDSQEISFARLDSLTIAISRETWIQMGCPIVAFDNKHESQYPKPKPYVYADYPKELSHWKIPRWYRFSDCPTLATKLNLNNKPSRTYRWGDASKANKVRAAHPTFLSDIHGEPLE